MKKWIPAALILAALAVSVLYYPHLPERIPTHWGLSGEPNGWSSRLLGAWMIPLLMAIIWVVMRAVPHLDPKHANYANFTSVYEWLIVATLAFMLGAHLLILAAARGQVVDIGRFVMAGIGAFFIVIGVILPKVHPNWFVGIRTPWTMTSDLSWNSTHRLGGWLFAVIGAVTLVAGFIMPKAALWVLLAGGGAVVVALFAYSYVVWKGDPARRDR